MTDDSSGTSYTVRAVRVQDPAQGASEFATPGPGHHFVGVEFTVTSVDSQVNEAADLDAAVQGSDGQIYSGTNCSGCGDITAGTDFQDHGTINLNPGRSETGWVSFVVPDGVKITSVTWTPGWGGGGTSATWGATGS